jgi:hypothetical protein
MKGCTGPVRATLLRTGDESDTRDAWGRVHGRLAEGMVQKDVCHTGFHWLIHMYLEKTR